MKDILWQQFVGGVGAVLLIFFFSAVIKLLTNIDVPLGEAAIGGIVTIAIGRTASGAYSYSSIQRTNIQTTGVPVPSIEASGPLPSPAIKKGGK